jgi:NADH dehydrogenase
MLRLNQLGRSSDVVYGKSRSGEGRRVTVFGASGFVGRYAVRALARDGWRILGAIRRPNLAGHLQPMGDVGQIHAVQANVRYADSVRRAVEGAEVVVNLVGIPANAGPQTFESVHVVGAGVVAGAAREVGVKRLVHISAICAQQTRAGEYARSKAEGEAAVLDQFPSAVILRPSLVFGSEDQLFNRLAAMARLSPFLPLIGGGHTRLQPVYVGDVAAAIAVASAEKAKPGTIYELGGPHIVTPRELLEMTLSWTGRRRCYMPIPFWLAKVMAAIVAPLPSTIRPVTSDEMLLLERPNVVSRAAIREKRTLPGLGIEHPNAMSTMVPAYLQRFHPRGQFAQYRQSRGSPRTGPMSVNREPPSHTRGLSQSRRSAISNSSLSRGRC